jgi:DNA-binding GntR family transcriptional regulator
LSQGWVESHLTIIAAVRDNHIDEACRLIAEQAIESSDRVRDQLRQQQNSTGDNNR